MAYTNLSFKTSESSRTQQKNLRKQFKITGEILLAKLKVWNDRDKLMLDFMKNTLLEDQKMVDRFDKFNIEDLSHYSQQTRDNLRRSFAFPGSFTSFFHNFDSVRQLIQSTIEQSTKISQSDLIPFWESHLQNNLRLYRKHFSQISTSKSSLRDAKKLFNNTLKSPQKNRSVDPQKAADQINDCHRSYIETYQNAIDEIKVAAEGRSTDSVDFIGRYVQLFKTASGELAKAQIRSIPFPSFSAEVSKFFFNDNLFLRFTCEREEFRPLFPGFEDGGLNILFSRKEMERPPSVLFYGRVGLNFVGQNEDELSVSEDEWILIHENPDFQWVHCSKLGSRERAFLPQAVFKVDPRKTCITQKSLLPIEGFLGFCDSEILLILETVDAQFLRCMNWRGDVGQVLISDVFLDL